MSTVEGSIRAIEDPRYDLDWKESAKRVALDQDRLLVTFGKRSPRLVVVQIPWNFETSL